MRNLTWYELAQVEEGSELVATLDFQRATKGEVYLLRENGLNEIWCAILLTPEANRNRHDRTYDVTIHAPLDPGADLQDDPDSEASQAWHKPSPFVCVHGFVDVLETLTNNDGACLYWQMPDVERAKAAVSAGAVEQVADLLIHPAATCIKHGMAYTLKPENSR